MLSACRAAWHNDGYRATIRRIGSLPQLDRATETSTAKHPSQYRAAQLINVGDVPEIKTVEWKNPHWDGDDQFTHFRRSLEGDKFSSNSGISVSGQVVQVGGYGRFKEGQHVCGVTHEGGLAEYCILRQDFTCTLKERESQHNPEICIKAFDGVRIECALRQFERYQIARFRSGRAGVLCVYGEGGLARLALDMLRSSSNERISSSNERIVLVTSSNRFSATDYGIDERDILVIGKQNVDQELRKRGGAKLVIATGQPREGLGQTLDAMRYGSAMCNGSELILLNPRKDHTFQLPIANFRAKNISIREAPTPDYFDVHRLTRIALRRPIRIKVAPFSFDQQSINEAWKKMEDQDSWEVPVVVFDPQTRQNV
ncbi:hypothetical protein JCM1840_001939 [Sporobolomyces johnsonii]